ncbi:hypothetical protein EDD15DRAFT_2362646 [Pisolithus albus]|nr:hypothetical protein EDD15DRAFT_2362646 [Pisolithus albus]
MENVQMTTNKPSTPLKGRSLVAHSTPFSLLRLVSIPAALRRKTDWFREAMDPMVDNDTCKTHWELSEGDSRKLLDSLFPDEVVFGLISTGELFKHQLNYFSMEQVFKNLVNKGLYNEGERRWSTAPDLSATATTACKKSLADFFNDVIECVNNACGTVRAGRKWTADSATRPLNGGDAVRKPDMSCWLTPGSEFDWRHLATFAKVKNRGGKDKEKSSYIEIAGKASCLLYTQDGCHAAPCFHILGSSIHLTIFDRGGSLSTCSYDINGQPYDFTVGVKTLDIRERDTKFTVELDRVLFISDNLFGRGTTVWGGIIRDKRSETGGQVAVKDSWIDPLRKYTEGRILSILNAHEIEGVPMLIHEQQVKAPSLATVANPLVNSSTHFLRVHLSRFKTSPYFLRVLSHIMTQPIGALITEFSCLGELLVAFLDYVVAHKNAVEVAHILHRDISLFNLFLASVTQRSDHKSFVERMTGLSTEAQVELCGRIAKLKQRGVLGDWGYAVPTSEHSSTANSDADHSSDASDPPTSPIEMVSQTASKTITNAVPRLVSISDLTRDDDIVVAMGPQSETESDLCETIDSCPLYHTGTWSWMSAQLVMAGAGQQVVHEPVHDLESLFYVLVGSGAIKVALDEVVAEGKEVAFKRDVYADVYADILGLMAKCDMAAVHRSKTKACCVQWAKIGRCVYYFSHFFAGLKIIVFLI